MKRWIKKIFGGVVEPQKVEQDPRKSIVDILEQREIEGMYYGEALNVEKMVAVNLILQRARALVNMAMAPCFLEYMTKSDQEIVWKIHAKLTSEWTEDDVRYLVNKIHEVVNHPIKPKL